MPDHAPTRRTRRRAHPDLSPSEAWRPAKRQSRLPAWIPAPLRKVITLTGKLGILALLAALVIGLFYIALAFRFDLDEVATMPERSIVLDAHGRELATLHGENRRLITREEIPPFFVQALQAREDKRFFEHHGVDAMGLARASLRNLKDLSFTQGASTLTMQLARNSFNMRERSLHRKLLEIALTLRIEAHYTKDEILTSYLNRIYFGSGCHGLEEAARTYFGVPASELTPNQSALLAGIIRAPHACSPLRKLPGALKQRNEVLDRMVAEQMITPEEASAIREDPLGLRTTPTARSGGAAWPIVQRHFDELLDAQDVALGGLTLHTTLDASLQAALEEEMARLGDQLAPGVEYAALALNPVTGGIVAAVGGRQPRPTRFHRALDAHRDLGALFAPFVLTAAAERGYPVDPRDPVATGRRLGNAEMIRLAKRFGFSGPFGEGDDLYRGTLSTTPLELATAAAVLANQGQRPRTHLIKELRAADHRLIFSNAPSAIHVISSDAADKGRKAYFSASPNPIRTSVSPAHTDVWGLLLTPEQVLCIWIGYDQPQPFPEPRPLQEKIADLLKRLHHWEAPTG